MLALPPHACFHLHGVTWKRNAGSAMDGFEACMLYCCVWLYSIYRITAGRWFVTAGLEDCGVWI